MFEVSSCGSVRSLDRVVHYETRPPMKLRGKMLRPGLASTGYRSVSLCGKSRNVHELVAAAFIGPRPDGCVIDHIDADRTNNHFSNLRYVTQMVNMRNWTKVRSRSGRLGVYPNGRGWIAQIGSKKGKTINLGTYPTIEEAASAREAYEAKHNYRGFVADVIAMKERL